MIQFIPSPNFSSRGSLKPEVIVLHIMLGSMGGTIEWFKQRRSQVSSHYLVAKDGRVVQMVRDNHTAWHAGKIVEPSNRAIMLLKKQGQRYINPNLYSLGIECEAKAGETWTPKQMDALVELVKMIGKKYQMSLDKDHIITHRDITRHKPDMEKWYQEVMRRVQRKEREKEDNSSEEKEAIKRQIIDLLNKL